VCFVKFPDRKQLQQRAHQPTQQPAAAPSKGHVVQPSTSSLISTHKGSSNKQGKWKDQEGAKKEALQAQVTQVQLLQSEVEQLRAQLANLTGKSSQPAGHVQSVPGPSSQRCPPRSLKAFLLMLWLESVYPCNLTNQVSLRNFQVPFALPSLHTKRPAWPPEFRPLGRWFRLMVWHQAPCPELKEQGL
jgi:hypothetical protein